MRYSMQPIKRHWPKRLLVAGLVGGSLLVCATIAVRFVYTEKLKPVSTSQTTKLITITQGATVDEIGHQLEKARLIKSAWAFKLYVSSKEARSSLQAGTYDISPSQSVQEIVAQLTHGKVATNLVTLLPYKRLDQIRQRLIQDGFSEADVDKALDAAQYAQNPALVDKPAGASLEGYLYPESYQKDANTSASAIISVALAQMNKRLTPDLRESFAKQGLSTYEGIILASIVGKEVSSQEDRNQVAQVFLTRLRSGMRLESDATASYGAILAGKTPSSSYDSVYNTYLHSGLPPTPISNVTQSALQAVAHPATTDWVYFLSGDDGVTHFARTLAEHQANARLYCKKCTQ